MVEIVDNLANGSDVHHDKIVPQLEQFEVLHLLADIHGILEGHDVYQLDAFQVYQQVNWDHLVHVRQNPLKIYQNAAITKLWLDFRIFNEVIYQPADDLKL